MAKILKLKRQIFLSILENDISRAGLFVKWIRFLNEGSICHFALTHSVQLNFGLLRQVFTTARRANQGNILGFKFKLQGRYVTITKTNINRALHFPVDNFAEYPSNDDLLNFFEWMQCTLDENNRVPRVLYQNHLPKEWTYVLHHNLTCFCPEDQWLPWNLEDASDHWIFHRS